MKARPSESEENVELRRQLEEGREKRSSAISRLKAAANRATKGRKTPITDKLRLPDKAMSESSDDGLPAIARLQPRVLQARRARTKEVRTLKQTTLAVVQIVQQSVSEPEDNGHGAVNGNGAAPQPT